MAIVTTDVAGDDMAWNGTLTVLHHPEFADTDGLAINIKAWMDELALQEFLNAPKWQDMTPQQRIANGLELILTKIAQEYGVHFAVQIGPNYD